MDFQKEKLKKYWEKFWFFVWKDDSFKGWIISILFIFIVIKFIFFPLLSLATGTSLPLAIVESCSMYHEGNYLSKFDDWWTTHEDNYESLGIDKTTIENAIFTKGFNKGDILFIVGAKPENIKIGDVIIYQAIQKDVIHRVVAIKKDGDNYIFSTMGDNVGHIQSFETAINENQLVGKAKIKLIPYIGWIKLIGADLTGRFLGRDFYYIKDGFCRAN